MTDRPADPIVAQEQYDPEKDPDLLALRHALDTKWSLQVQPAPGKRTSAIVYAGDAHKASIVIACESASQLSLDALGYIVALHNARVALEQEPGAQAPGTAPSPPTLQRAGEGRGEGSKQVPCPACPLREEIESGLAPLCDHCTPTRDGSELPKPALITDKLQANALKIIREAGYASCSLLQRRFAMNYSTASQLINILVAQGHLVRNETHPWRCQLAEGGAA